VAKERAAVVAFLRGPKMNGRASLDKDNMIYQFVEVIAQSIASGSHINASGAGVES
jgi:hypothetical protein